jgi:membrane-associated phospholipid phosphatase
VVTFAAFAARKPETLRYLWAMALTTVIAGTALATLFSSVGPIFYENFVGEPRLAGLMANLREHPANESLFYHSDYLLRNYLDGETQLGTGISAMPSMHVAIVILNALYLGRLNRWLGAIGWLFALLIVFGSVYTGWHYAVDGYVAMIVVGVIWLSTGRLLNRRAGT